MEEQQDYIHRDINWCDFNARVLAEAKDATLPLLDRIKFLAIFSSNLDEFFRVKVASLRKLQYLKKKKASKWLGYSPKELLRQISEKVAIQQNDYGNIWRSEILPALAARDIHIYQHKNLILQHRQEVNKYFRVHVQGYLHLVMVKPSQKVKLKNRGIYLVAALTHKVTRERKLGFVNIPNDQVDRFKKISPVEGKTYYIFLDDIIRSNFTSLFTEYDIAEHIYSIKLNRDEDYEIEDEFSGNLINKIKEKIDRRSEGDPVRFLHDFNMPKNLLTEVQECCGVAEEDVFAGGRYHNLNELFQLTALLEGVLEGQELPHIAHSALEQEPSILRAMDKRDYLLHYPYHKYDPVLRFFNEAAVDPAVKAIKITLYRISKKSQIAQSLISAARNGKQVTVFVEVKARYDEINNLHWAQEMQKAGISIIYSLPGLKVHAKVATVLRKNSEGKLVRYAYMATGNFNEKTATVYADHGLFTIRRELTKELDTLFDFLKSNQRDLTFEHLLVAGFNMKQRLIAAIDNEIANAKVGKEAFAIVKLNSLDEREMIDKLYEASNAGVKITLIVRAGCSLVPGVEQQSENIVAYRLVDMYLEHARVYWFCNGGKDDIYLSSADWMNRNLNRRIEVGFPLVDEVLKEEVKHIIQLQLKDNVKLTSIRLSDNKTRKNGTGPVRAQLAIHQWVEQKEHSLKAQPIS
ncbi:MAG: polyphosphate kinase 1 [Cyclobacteriaceae bacterium]